MTHSALTLAIAAMLAMGSVAPALETKPKAKPAPLPYLSEPYEARAPDHAPAPGATPTYNDVRNSANSA